MSDTTTIARPYAKAIFKHALSEDQLAIWSTILDQLTQAVLHPDAAHFISNPIVTADLQVQLLLAVFVTTKYPDTLPAIENFVRLLADNKRLATLPDIYAQYESLRSEQEKTLTVNVSSFLELTPEQQQQLVDALSRRLQRQVTLNMTLDSSLIGGAVIRAGDFVIDGSVRGQLNKLNTNLAA
jgi:F-type H+-transporting ATPase subunit delta